METTYLASDVAIRDHLDLVVGPQERCGRTAFFVLCDAGRPLAHICVDELDPDPAVEECAQIVDPFATALAQETSDGNLLVALTRPGPARIDGVDRRWFHAVHATCRHLNVGVLGVYIVTAYDMAEIHPDDAT